MVSPGSLKLLLIAIAAVPTAARAEIQLEWPVDCTVGKTCAIQHYVDRDPGPGARDYMGGTLTYDGHNGVDIRLPTMAAERAGVAVLAAAPGVVLRVRDGMPDVSVREVGRESVRGRDCGNGLVVAHADGFETQYCHMARGSLVVRPGQKIAAGQKLGVVGLSGDTEFPHLHFTVRQNGVVVDPFAAGADADEGGPKSLWDPALRPSLAYKAESVLNAGFAPGPVTMQDVENGAERPPGPEAPALVAFVRAIGLRQGDVQRLTLTGPDGREIADRSSPALDGNKDQVIAFIGRRRPPAGWPSGTYRATYSVQHDGRVVLDKSFDMQM